MRTTEARSLAERLTGLAPGGLDGLPDELITDVALVAAELHLVESHDEQHLPLTAKVTAAAWRECERQGVGPDRLLALLVAWRWARDRSAEHLLPDVSDVLAMAGMAEPSNGGRFRLVPAVFAAGGRGASPRSVPDATYRLFELLDAETDPDELVRFFLSVHPFTDGNGRVAWLLRTWLTGTWDDPEPLPDYQW